MIWIIYGVSSDLNHLWGLIWFESFVGSQLNWLNWLIDSCFVNLTSWGRARLVLKNNNFQQQNFAILWSSSGKVPLFSLLSTLVKLLRFISGFTLVFKSANNNASWAREEWSWQTCERLVVRFANGELPADFTVILVTWQPPECEGRDLRKSTLAADNATQAATVEQSANVVYKFRISYNLSLLINLKLQNYAPSKYNLERKV